MSKIDCSNIFNFMSEWERRRKLDSDTWKPLGTENIFGNFNPFEYPADELKRAVVKLQDWSDANPKQTRREKFIKMCEENGFEEYVEQARVKCANFPEISGMPCVMRNCNECKEYWEEFVD